MTTPEASAPKKPWYMKWWVWLIAAVLLIGGIGNALGMRPSNEASPSTSPTPEVGDVMVPDLAGAPGDEAKATLDDLGLRSSFDGGEESVWAESNWDVVRTDPAAGAMLHEGESVRVYVVRADERLAAEAAARAAEPVGEDVARELCSARAELEFPYGVKLHWVVEALASEQRDGGVWFLKVGATVTNAFNAEQKMNVECWVSGTNGAPVMDDFLAY